MSSDSEFERFLQESLSASDTSADISISKTGSPDDGTHLATSQNALNDDKYWWNTHYSSDESDNSEGIVGLKDGSTWLKPLKSETKLGGQSSNGYAGHPLVSAQDSPAKTPLVLPTAESASAISSGAEDFTHDSLDTNASTLQHPSSEEKHLTSPVLKDEVSSSSQASHITEQRSEREITLGSSHKQLEKDYEESSFESVSEENSDDLDKTLQPNESKPVSKSSSYSSLYSANKQSTDESVALEDKHVSANKEVSLSPALSKASATSSKKLAVEQNLETENTAMSDHENNDKKVSPASSTASKLSSTSEVSVTSRPVPNSNQPKNTECIAQLTDSVVTGTYPNGSSVTSQPSLMASSLDKQMAELQEALRVAGLPPISNSSKSNNTINDTPISAGGEAFMRSPSGLPEDIEEVLRELATQEIVSLSKKILHEKQTEMEEEEVQATLQQLQTAPNKEIKIPLHEKSSKEIHMPSSDCNIASSSENLLADIAFLKDFSTQSSDEAAASSKDTGVRKKKTLLKPNAKRESVFQRLSVPKSTNPAMKKPPTSKKVTPKSTRRSRVSASSSQKKEKQSTFEGQGTYDLKSTTEVILGHTELVKSGNGIDTGREQKLLQEIENWQNSWKEEKDLCDQLRHQLEEKEREFMIKEEKMALEHNKEKHQLKQEIFVLASKVKELECETDSRKRVASGGQLDKVISEEQRKQLELNIKEQETLLQGYQKENERVYEELTKARSELKTVQTRAFEENQQLAQQLANLKEELQKKDEQLVAAGKGGGALGLERISQLETQLASISATCSQLDENIAELEKQNVSLQEEISRLSVINKELKEKLSVSIPDAKFIKVKEDMESEVKHLKQQLKWYVENQQLIDSNIEAAQKKDKEIALLKEKLSKKVTNKKLAKDKAADASRIQQLEKQVKAMETSIRQKYPDSITSLIYASKSIEEDPSSSDTGYLNSRIQQLEKELEAKDKEMSLKIRALHQKHTNMEVLYEQQVQTLKEELQNKVVCEAHSQSSGNQPHHGLTNVFSEVAELKKTCSILQQERDALLSAQHVNANSAEMTSLILKENVTLKSQMRQLEIEMAHQKVKYNTLLTEGDANIKQLQRAQEREVSDIQQKHQLAMKQLMEECTSRQSESHIAQLKSQLATQQVTITRLKEQLHKHKTQEQLLTTAKHKEEKLSQEVNLLKEELLEATKGHTPEMHHFHLLLSKLKTLENRIIQYETRLQSQMSSNWCNKDDRISTLQEEWAKKLRGKDIEIENFRKDLDAIIESLQHLHDQYN